MIESTAPTSWKCTSSGDVPWTPPSTAASRRKTAPALARATSGSSARSTIARTSSRRRSGWSAGAVMSIEVAARPCRVVGLPLYPTSSRSASEASSAGRSANPPRLSSAPSSMSPLTPHEQSSQPMRLIPGRAVSHCGIRLALRRDPRRASPGDPGGEHPGAETVVDVDHRDARRAGVEHREQGRDPAEGGAVPDAGRHGDDRRTDQTADDAGQRALHPGDDDKAVGLGQSVALGEQAVQTGHADVGDPADIGTEGASDDGRLGRDSLVAGAGRHDDHRRRVGRGTRQARRNQRCRRSSRRGTPHAPARASTA